MSSGKTLILFVSQFPHMSNGAAVIVLVMGLRSVVKDQIGRWRVQH